MKGEQPMQTSEKLGLNLSESSDFVDITKISENFEKLDEHVDVINLLRLGSYDEIDTNPSYAWGSAGTSDGISYKREDSGGTITLNGEATDSWYGILFETEILPETYLLTGNPEKYTFSGCPEGGSEETYYISIAAYYAGEYYELAKDCGTGCTFTLTEQTYLVIRFYYKKGMVFDKTTIKPMLVRGSTKPQYYIPPSKYIDGKKGVTIDKILERFAEKYLANNFVKEIQIAGSGYTYASVYQIGTVVIGRITGVSSTGYTSISGLPETNQETYVTAISTSGNKIYTEEMSAGATSFGIGVPSDAAAVITFMYETA